MKFFLFVYLILISNFNFLLANIEEDKTDDRLIIVRNNDNITKTTNGNNSNNSQDDKANKEINMLDVLKYDIKPEEIQQLKKQKEEFLKIQNSKVEDFKGAIKKVTYKDGEYIDVVLRVGFTSILTFQDEFGNNLQISNFHSGEDKITISQTGYNRIILNPMDKYFSTNLIVMLKDYDKPIHIRIREDNLSSVPDTDLTILIPNAYTTKSKFDPNTYDGSIGLKSTLLRELQINGEIQNSKELGFKVIDLKTNKKVDNLDLHSKIRFIKVKRFNKEYLICDIDNEYSLVGYSYASFSRYNNSRSVTYIEPNTMVLVITNKISDYSEEPDWIDNKSKKYFNEFRRYQILLENK